MLMSCIFAGQCIFATEQSEKFKLEILDAIFNFGIVTLEHDFHLLSRIELVLKKLDLCIRF